MTELVTGLVVAMIVWACYKNHYSAFHLKYRTFWPRFWAPTIDEVILWLPTSAFPLILYYSSGEQPWVWSTMSFCTALVYFGYSIWMHGRYGATFGKQACKVRVVDAVSESTITYRQALIRDSVPIVLIIVLLIWAVFLLDVDNLYESKVMWLIPLIYLLWFLAEIVTMFTNKKRRALHDYMAGTVVVRADIWETEQRAKTTY